MLNRRSAAGGRAVEVARGLVALAKLRIVELLLITTVPSMIVARRGMPGFGLIIATITGGTLAAAGANAFNMVLDRDIDGLMMRTRHRPLVTGVISTTTALVFASVVELLGFGLLWRLVNPLSAVLTLSATAFYVIVYTAWLKRSTSSNIVIGGVAGAVPVLVGWTAVTGRLGIAPLLMFGIVTAWTPPHFWALAIRYRDDYSAASVPMLPSVAPLAHTTRQILRYSLVLVVLSLGLGPAAHLGLIYTATAALSGGLFARYAIMLHKSPTAANAMKLFSVSISYLTVLFGAMALDQLVGHL